MQRGRARRVRRATGRVPLRPVAPGRPRPDTAHSGGCADTAADIGYRRSVAPKPKSLVRTLARRGPHRVLRGDLSFAGLPGIVCTPEAGFGLPALVFGHDWLTPPHRYTDTLAHLASWGFVAVAPATARGPVPSARTFADDLSTAVDIATSVRLGPGRISVSPGKVALAGHGFGAGAAVLAAARHHLDDPHAGPGTAGAPGTEGGSTESSKAARKATRKATRTFDTPARGPVSAVALLYPSPTSPPSIPVAGRVQAPALILSEPGQDGMASPESTALADAWGAEVTSRIVPAAEERSIVEDRLMAKFVGLPPSDKGLQATTRAALTGFLLATVTGSKDHAVFTDESTVLPGTAQIAEEPQDGAGDMRSRVLHALAGR